jgi:hypothetical protein
MVERHFPAQRAIAEFEQMIFAVAGERERFLSEPDERREGGAPLRLQPEKNAGGLEKRRLPLPVSPDKKIKPGSELDPERFKAAKISELKVSEHFSQSSAVAASLCRGAVRSQVSRTA